MFGETTIFHVKIWNHPIEITIYIWLFGVPGFHFIYKPDWRRRVIYEMAGFLHPRDQSRAGTHQSRAGTHQSRAGTHQSRAGTHQSRAGTPLRIEMFMSVFKSIQIERGEVASENLTYMEFDAWQMRNRHMKYLKDSNLTVV